MRICGGRALRGGTIPTPRPSGVLTGELGARGAAGTRCLSAPRPVLPRLQASVTGSQRRPAARCPLAGHALGGRHGSPGGQQGPSHTSPAGSRVQQPRSKQLHMTGLAFQKKGGPRTGRFETRAISGHYSKALVNRQDGLRRILPNLATAGTRAFARPPGPTSAAETLSRSSSWWL